ncbi:MAG: hypothetical protein KJP16_10805 [Gammaproteobacteria bacterium]|nr:hypothetical protein [Gammaproteobacteria bacterium]NNL51298.1 hypothetical protein [Woeseiaceae bacterium]
MNTRKLLQTILILVAAAVAISGVADDISRQQAEESLKRALATFAVARTLNGVISVAQGTELAVEPGGVGVIMTPGQILDPVNDLIERFSSVMLFAASSLGLQLVLLEITSWVVITALLVAALAVWLVATWSDKVKANRYVAIILRVTMFLAFLRFAIPIVIISTNFLFDTFLSEKHDTAAAELSVTATEIEELNIRYDEAAMPQGAEPGSETPQTAAANGSDEDSGETDSAADLSELGARWASAAKDWYDGIKGSAEEWSSSVADWFSSMNVSARMSQLQQSATNATSHIVNLIVIFVLQTIILPIAFLWLFIELLKSVASRSIALLNRPPASSAGPSAASR